MGEMRYVGVPCPRCGRPITIVVSGDGEPVDMQQYDCDCLLTGEEERSLLDAALRQRRGEGEMSRLDEIRRRLTAATLGPLALGIVDPDVDPGEWFRNHLSYGPDGNIWCVWCPKHPLTRGEPPRPEHAVLTAITGNGPTSEANAEFYAHAPADIRDLLAVAVAAAALPWLKRGLYIEVPDVVGLSGPSKDARLLRLHAALAPLLEKEEGGDEQAG